jgi:hypothetical protein
VVKLCRPLETGHAVKIKIHIHTPPTYTCYFYPGSTYPYPSIYIHPYILLLSWKYESTYISHLDPPRKQFYSYTGSELSKNTPTIHDYPLLANKAPNIHYATSCFISPERGLGALKKEEREEEKGK